MGPANWAGILFSASLLTAWSLPTAAHFTPDVHPLNAMKGNLAKPTISVSPGTAIEYKETVNFYCSAEGINITIHWVFNNHYYLKSYERMQLSPDGKNLTILKVQREDSGTYQCEARDLSQVHSSDPTFLTVHYGPDPIKIKLEPGISSGEEAGVIEGSNVIFSVETHSRPSPDYFWFFRNDSTPSFTMRNFTIHAVSKEHEGMYRCLVSNSVTHQFVQDTLKVRVLKRLSKPHIVSQSPNLLENASSVPLTCQATQEGARVQWLLRGQLLLPSKHMVLSANNKTLAIHGLWRNDMGPYECEVWNWDSWIRSEPLLLNISYGPDGVHIVRGSESGVVSNIKAELNSSLTLQCQANSQPVAEYHWTLPYSTTVHTGGMLTIAALSLEHQGIYNCTALNSLTSLAHSASVLVTVVVPQSSLSAGTIAVIAIGILTVIALSTGLGYFLYIKKGRWPSKKTAEASIYDVTTPTSEKEHAAEPSSNCPGLVYANIPETWGQVRVKKMLSPETPEQFYEKKLPSETDERYSHSPTKPSPKLTFHPLVPTLPKGNMESNYEVLVNTTCNVYCQIKPPV